MTRRNIIECDRHRGEIRNNGGVYNVTIETPGGEKRTLELCDTCKTKLDRFLSGQELEVPP